MPKRRSVKSLKDCCLRRIALSFDSYFLKDFDLNFKELPRLLYILGPFQDLTNETIRDIINSLVEQKCLRRWHFSCLLQKSVRHLDLSKVTAANGDIVVKTIIARCTNLTTLNLHGLDSVSATSLSILVNNVPTLRMLNLKQTNCNDQVLSALAHHNPSLTDLDISNTRVTDSGAFSLCQAWDEEGNLGCRSLLRLDIYGTMIRFKGALHLLQNLPKLQYLGFDDVCSLIEADLKQQENKIVEQRSLELRYLTSHQLRVHPVTTTSIEVACALCQTATEVRFYCGVNDENVGALKHLKTLRNLQLGNGEGQTSFTFDRGVLPVLVEIGNQLTDLTLADINDLDLLSIGVYCRNLRSFFLVVSGQNDQTPFPRTMIAAGDKQNLFRKLQEFYIVCSYEEFHFPVSAFVTALSNAKELKTLHIHYMEALTTEVFVEILKTNPMICLECLKLISCNNVGEEVLESLIKGENRLRSLELHACQNITLQDCEKYQKYCRKQGYDLEISWK